MAAGSLDTGFGTGGIVTTSIGGYNGADAIVLQSDGKIVVAGTVDNLIAYVFGLVRYNINGSLDTGFGTGGIVTTTIGAGSAYANAVAIQSDGKIVVAGTVYSAVSGNLFALVRYNTNGSLDTGFGTGGIVTTTIGAGNDYANAVAIQSDGKIVAAGAAYIQVSGTLFALVRYNTNGSLDTGFGTGGIVTTIIGAGGAYGNAVAIQSDGKIVVAGGGSWEFALVRYNTNGSLDTGFGTGGIVTTNIGAGNDNAYAVAIQSDGKLVAAGFSYDSISGNNIFALVRYNINGSLDTGFGTGGIVTTDIGAGNDYANAVAIQSDGKLVAAGFSYVNTYSDFALARYKTTGYCTEITFNWTALPAYVSYEISTSTDGVTWVVEGTTT